MVLAINAWDEPESRITRYARKEKLKQRFLLDGSEVWKTQYDALLPQTVWIDRDGVILDRTSGYDPKTGPGDLEARTKRLVETTHEGTETQTLPGGDIFPSVRPHELKPAAR